MKQRLIAALAVLAMILAPVAEAKSYGGGSRSGGSSFRSSGSSSSKSSGGSFFGGSSSKSSGSSSSKAAKPSSGNNSKTYSKPASKVEQQRYKDAVKSGKAFNTKEAATADFKAKYGSQYSSSFKTEPKTRPSYIPSRTRYNGRDVDIVYNPGMGYGYWGGGGPGLGTFLLYDAISDAAMASVLMNNHGYHVGPKPVVYTSGWAIFAYTLLGLVALFGVWVLLAVIFR